jgi:phage shock protein A
MGILKPVIWISIAGTLATGTAFAVMGPHRAHALMGTVHSKINATIDSQIDDPVALRQQLRNLADQYPGRIAEVKGDLAELQSQIADLGRDRAISIRTAELAAADFNQMKSLLAKAQSAQNNGQGAIVRVRFGDDSLDMSEAFAKADQIGRVHDDFSSKAADLDANLTVLRQQEARLDQILAQLEGEQSEFQIQLGQLDRQVDAIARNDRMIEMLEKRHESFAKYDRYGDVASPDHVKGHIARILAEQNARLNDLSLASNQNDYERQAEADLARQELRYQTRIGNELLDGTFPTIEFEPDVIEITPDSEAPTAPRGPLASNR